VLGKGGHTTTLGALLFSAITESDNTANDKLMRSVGGPQAVRDMIEAKKLGSIRFYEGERCASVADRGPHLEPKLLGRRCLLQGAQRIADLGPKGIVRTLCRRSL
jgi:beta-lactamase class A